MSLTGDNTAKFWATCPKVLGHRRRSSSSGLFNINLTEPILAKYKHLAKLHSESSTGFNAINRPSLPRGTLFRSSLPATPLTSPMYTSVLHQFTERAIQDLLGKSSTPKVFKSSSDYDLKLENAQSGTKVRTNLFDIPNVEQNIITRGSLMARPKTLDIKSKLKLEPHLTKINENGKLEEEVNNESPVCNHSPVNNQSSMSLYYSIKEEQEETDNDCVVEEEINKSGDKLITNTINLSIDESTEKSIELSDSTSKDTIISNKAIDNSIIETIVLDDSPIISETVQNLANVSIDEKKSSLVNGNESDKNLAIIEKNGLSEHMKHESNDVELQMNCLFVKNLHYNLNNDELRDYFCKFGRVVQSRIIFDHHSKQSKCFGFVTFNSENDVQKILSMPKETFKLRGRLVQLSLAKNRKK